MTIPPESVVPWPSYIVARVRRQPIYALGKLRVSALGQSLYSAYQVGRAGLATIDPISIKSVTVTDQNTVPSTDKLFKSFPGSVSMNHKTGDRRIGHNPQPVELATFFSG